MAARTEEPRHPWGQYDFVPEELCVVVAIDSDIGDEASTAHSDLYRKVQARLNEELPRLVRWHGEAMARKVAASGGADEPAVDDAFQGDIQPTALMRQLAARSAESADERFIVDLERVPDPKIVLTHANGATIALYYYGVARAAALEDERHNPRVVVRELTKLVNRHLTQLPPVGGPDDERWRINGSEQSKWRFAAATPNWLAAAGQDGFTGGGPAAPPQPLPPRQVTTGKWTFQFTNPQLAALAGKSREASANGLRIKVAVLDTCPTYDAVVGAANRYGENQLLQEVRPDQNPQVKIDDPVPLGTADFAPAAHFLPNWGDDLDTWKQYPTAETRKKHYPIPDHGLFAAGIIRDIAPQAEIHVVRVLDDAGVGDTYGLIKALRALPGKLLTDRRNERLIVNLSLMVSVPDSKAMLEEWFARSAKDAATLAQWWRDIDVLLDSTHRNLFETIEWLGEQGVLVVAAAGNDYNGSGYRAEPRLPAAYDSVLGVAAVNRQTQPANFSNRGDRAVYGNGVAVFGGSRGALASGRAAEEQDKIIGIFSAEKFPLGAGANKTGWGYWAGTSFATPVISAIAANLWSAHSGTTIAQYGPPQLIWDVRQYVSQAENPLEVWAIKAEQRPR
ncbi:MAG: S8 family serine peptidase [Thermomicrobiales bacterium]